MSFNFYESPTTDSASHPRITVRRGGLMVLTQAAVDLTPIVVPRQTAHFLAPVGSESPPSPSCLCGTASAEGAESPALRA